MSESIHVEAASYGDAVQQAADRLCVNPRTSRSKSSTRPVRKSLGGFAP